MKKKAQGENIRKFGCLRESPYFAGEKNRHIREAGLDKKGKVLGRKKGGTKKKDIHTCQVGGADLPAGMQGGPQDLRKKKSGEIGKKSVPEKGRSKRFSSKGGKSLTEGGNGGGAHKKEGGLCKRGGRNHEPRKRRENYRGVG